jgi:SAM-dependent methyltransferase
MDSPSSDFRLKLTFGLSIFLSAFLLFQIEPIIAKIILPWFGGAAAVWSVCLLFFQITLLLGYLYAHVLATKVPGKFRSWLHIGLLTASLFLLPVIPSSAWKPNGTEDPTLRVLVLLALTIGLPYLLLSATSPLLQSWFSNSTGGQSPYRFYSLSNIGSMLGLLSYPLLVEPLVSTRHQAIIWSVAYGVFVLACGTLAFRHRRFSEIVGGSQELPVVARSTKLLWIGLAACGSTLLLAITNHVTQNIASVPFLWIAPLSLYLLSFILCFADRGWYRRNLYLRFLGVALGVMTYALAPEFINIPLYVLLPVFCLGLFLCCMVLHGELAQLKPHPSQLTLFYLLISLGGALGALFVALLAPHIFNGFYELPIALGACAVFVLWALHHTPEEAPHWRRTWPILVGVTALLIVGLYRNTFVRPVMPRLMARNFYGALRVVDAGYFSSAIVEGVPALSPHDPYAYRTLMNGSIDHGSQFLSPERRREPTTYYSEKSGVGIALQAAARSGPLHVGIIGLGAGTIASYANASDRYVFYEINPNVIRIANTEFSYLRDAEARGAKLDTVLGDARLSLEREQPQQFDILAVDAFSSDSIPVHLLTREAFDLYFRHLKPGGTLAVHVSNRYLNLQPVVTRAATPMGREVLMVANEPDQPKGISRATWVLVCDRGGLLEQEGVRPSGTLLKSSIPRPLWTDDYSSLLPLLK